MKVLVACCVTGWWCCAGLLAQPAVTPPPPPQAPAAPGTPAAPAKPDGGPGEARPATALVPGMPAPPLTVEHYLKGDPIGAFEKGKVYVIDFWATWCNPCIASMPHLSHLQQVYKDQGLRVVAVNIWEDKHGTPYSADTMKSVEAFVAAKGSRLDYTVAYDGAAKATDSAWMAAAQRRGIPSTFVVDGEGKIAWIGHPAELDIVLDQVFAGKWTPGEGFDLVRRAAQAYRDAIQAYAQSVEAGDRAWKGAEKDWPAMAQSRMSSRMRMLLAREHGARALEVGAAIVDRAVAEKNAPALIEVVNALDDKKPAGVDWVGLMRRAAEEFFKLEDNGKEADPYMVLARAMSASGEYFKAVEKINKALELAKPGQRFAIESVKKKIEEGAKAGAGGG